VTSHSPGYLNWDLPAISDPFRHEGINLSPDVMKLNNLLLEKKVYIRTNYQSLFK